MNFVIRRKNKNTSDKSLYELYPHDLQFYSLPPSFEISLAEFEDLAFERLQLLRILEQASVKESKIYTEEWKQTVLSEIKKAGLKHYFRLIDKPGFSNTEIDIQARKADHISHFILRLAYSRSEDLRRWFLSREQELFRLRFQSLTAEGMARFLKLINLAYSPISSDEKDSIHQYLVDSTPILSVGQIEKLDFYKVPFVEVSDLVKNRKVYLRKGFAYIPASELVVCVISIFRSHLSQSLVHTSRRLPAIDDDRLRDLLQNLHSTYTGPNYIVPADKRHISLANIDSLARHSFPLCMRSLHETLRTGHHLKHFARLQFGLFLKGIGMTMEDLTKFWRDEFVRKIEPDTFDKEHVYNIKHMYGKVGAQINYTPYSCLKIITGNVGTGEHHGCPFRHWDQQAVKNKLKEYGIGYQGILEISDLVARGHFQIACGKYFEYTHNAPSKNSINHPNQYFEESQELLTGDAGDAAAKAPRIPKTAKLRAKQRARELDDSGWDDSLDLSGVDLEAMQT